MTIKPITTLEQHRDDMREVFRYINTELFHAQEEVSPSECMKRLLMAREMLEEIIRIQGKRTLTSLMEK